MREFRSGNVFTILKRIFSSATGNKSRTAVSERVQSDGGNESAEISRPVAADASHVKKRKGGPVEEEEVEERKEISVKEEIRADPLQTAPLELLPETNNNMSSSPLTRNTGVKEEKYGLYVVQRSHLGAVRERNEDACFTFASESGGDAPFPPVGLFIVADGMGGHLDGHRASNLVSRIVASHILERLYLPLLRGDDPASRPPVQEVMESAVNLANDALYIPDRDKEMGTTLTAALIFGSRLFLVHVGDSRAYLATEGEELQSVTTDHSVVQALQDAGQLTAEEAAVHPNRNLLLRALMGEPLEQIDAFTRSLPEEGTLLLCSDGLWGLVSDATIQEILQGEKSLPEKADRLVEKALESGGHDNITVVLVDFKL